MFLTFAVYFSDEFNCSCRHVVVVECVYWKLAVGGDHGLEFMCPQINILLGDRRTWLECGLSRSSSGKLFRFLILLDLERCCHAWLCFTL